MRNKTKIAWVTENYVDVDYPIIKELLKDFDIKWIISHHCSSSFFSDQEYDAMKKEIGVNIEIVKTNKRNRNPLNLFHYLKIIRKVNATKSQIIYLNILGFPYFHPLALNLFTQKKVIYAAHDVLEHSGIKNRSLLLHYKAYIFKKIQYFQTFSDSQNELLIKKYPEKKSFVGRLCLKDYGEANKDAVSSNAAEDKRINFLFFGKIRPNKGLDTLIKAVNQIDKKFSKQFSVTIAGDSQNWEDYESLIEDSRLFNLEIGFVSNERIVELFQETNYLILPYKDMTQSGVIMVAYNYKVPVIASDFPEFRNYVEHKKTGFLFEAQNVSALTQTMEQIVQNQFDYKTIQNNLSQFIDENISSQAISLRYKDFFNGLSD